MSNSKKYRPSSSLSLSRKCQFATYGDGRGVVVPKTILLSSQKFDFGRGSHDWVFSHIRVISQHPSCIYLGVGIIQLVILVVFCLVFPL